MVSEAKRKEYFKYLQHRSLLGQIYHSWYLYPRICKELQGRVLDFGCGIGGLLKFRVDTVGVDINKYNINHCKSIGLEAELLRSTGEIPFEHGVFSSVVMDNVIEHIPVDGVDAVINEVARVLEPGGIIIAGVPGIKGYHSDNDHKVFYTENDLITLFFRHGFGVRKIFYMPLSCQFLDKYLSQHCVYIVFQDRK